MDNAILVALLALAGTLVGSFSGILVANKLVNYRLDLLEKKVGNFNNFAQRVSTLEGNVESCQSECIHKRREHLLMCHPTVVPLKETK